MAIDHFVFVGTVHTHPRGPTLLAEILHALHQRLGAPAFIAVECHPDSVVAAVARREIFESRLKAEGLNEPDAAALSEVPLYEGRVVSGYQAAGTPIVWLDEQGDIATWDSRMPDILARFVHERQIGVLRSWAEGCFDAHAYERFDDSAREREARLFERLRTGLAEHSARSPYATVVVGANHASQASHRLCGMCAGELGLQTSQVWCTERWQWEIDHWLPAITK